MLRQAIYRPKRRWRLWPLSGWARAIIFILLGLIFFLMFFWAIQKGSSRQLVHMLMQQRFPFEAVILEGIPGYSAPARERLAEIRKQGLSLGMFLLTGVNVSDARTYFLSYFFPPPQGPAWLGWAYNPGDPEFEGPILEEQPAIPGEQSGHPPVPVSKEVLVGIYHTHNSESYTGDGGPEHRQGENGDVVTVGEVLKKALEKNGVKTVHSTQIHDADDFMKAYSASVITGSKLLKEYPSTRLLLDIHRDGRPPEVGKSIVRVKGKEAGRILIVLGQKNPHWRQNEALAKEIIALGEKKYPGLFIPNISYAADARYNQHLSEGALLMEIGSQLNTLEEACTAAEALADVLAEWLKEHKVKLTSDGVLNPT